MHDHIAIAHTIHEVARAFDEKLHNSVLPKVFTPDAAIIYWLRGYRYDFSMPDGANGIREIHERCRWTQHLVSPHVLSVEGDAASARTPVHALHLQVRTDGSHHHWVVAGFYEDKLVRNGQDWRICDRKALLYYSEGDQMLKGVIRYPDVPGPEAERIQPRKT